jgi:CHAD domain-containing protein
MARPSVAKKAYRRENARFRGIGRELASARDSEVKLQTLTDLAQAADDLDGVEEYRAALARECGEAGATDSEISLAVAELAWARGAVPDWSPDGGWEPAGAGFVRAYARGRKALAAVEQEPSDEAVHEWRKRSKDLWYHLRIVRRAWPGALEPLADEAHELSDLLGDHHDLAVLAEDAAERPKLFTDGAQGTLVATIRARQGRLLKDALPIGERLYAERPKAFGKRLRAYSRAKRL